MNVVNLTRDVWWWLELPQIRLSISLAIIAADVLNLHSLVSEMTFIHVYRKIDSFTELKFDFRFR